MSSDKERALDIVRKQREDFLGVYESELRLFGESAGGLYGLIASEPDYSCFKAKKLFGKRDKNWGAAKI
ncbi:MAG: hypothetical protein RQ839_01170 [Thermoproteus sp.]|nr:MAG: hypothetical protein AT715_09935 [Thermoproteus sp. JCHS_4]MDT7868778.1 hypothetical protein [Thermoproteus sp.]MDT7881009.1 hypothetical protein [Thermoproteus sp.]